MKKNNNKGILFLVIAVMMIICTVMPIQVFASESAAVLSTAQYESVKGSFNAYLENDSGTAPTKLYVVGNKTGGGANTSLIITGTGIYGGSATVRLDGTTQVVNLVGMTANVTDLHYACTIGDSGTYNIAFWITG